MENWNVYTPIILPVDLNDDGVNEIVIAHGGNPGKYSLKFILCGISICSAALYKLIQKRYL
jgi:hypothetical protein